MDAEESLLNFDYVQLDFNPKNFLMGLVDAFLKRQKRKMPTKLSRRLVATIVQKNSEVSSLMVPPRL